MGERGATLAEASPQNLNSNPAPSSWDFTAGHNHLSASTLSSHMGGD